MTAKARLRRGFKTEAENLASEMRTELGIGSADRLDPFALAALWEIPVLGLAGLVAAGASISSIRYFRGDGKEVFSAVTLVDGHRRVIVHNDAHSPVRQASNVAHELSHVALEHEPHEALDESGCRKWNVEMEAEADWLAGALLVPRAGALYVARQGMSVEEAAARFHVSLQMMRWRLGQTGASRQAQYERVRWQQRTRKARR